MGHSTADKAAQVIAAIVAVTNAVLDEIEYELAMDALAEIERQCAEAPPASHIVNEVEKAVGLGFTDDEYAHAVHAVDALLGRKLPVPAPTEDAHLEMQYEGRFEPDFAMD